MHVVYGQLNNDMNSVHTQFSQEGLSITKTIISLFFMLMSSDLQFHYYDDDLATHQFWNGLWAYIL